MTATQEPIATLLRRGFADHQGGRLGEAEAAYRQVLAIEPDHADGLYLLGVLAHQVGRNDIAVDYLGRAARRAPRRPDFHCSLGLVLNQLGRTAEAEAALKTALRLKPDFADALNNLGIAQSAQGRHAAAEASYRKAIRLTPNFPDVFNNLGLVQAALGRPADAEGSYRKALRLNPRLAEAHGNLGIVLARLERLEEAEASYREALRLSPGHWDSLNNLGVLLSGQGHLAEAESLLAEAARSRADRQDALGNLGVVLTRQGRAGDALGALNQALRLAPASADAHFNLGAALHDLRRMDEAVASYRAALGFDPNHAEVHGNLAYALLLRGEFLEGWREHEWRWRTRHMKGGERDFAPPRWDGEPIGDRVILLHAEQGLGDTLQFCRYASLIGAEASVVLEVQPSLARLMSSLAGVTRVIPRGEPLPSFDLHCPLLSLPLACGATLEAIPATVPYLTADPTEAARWRERLAGLPGLKVGLVWAGEPKTGYPELAAVDRRRSMTLATFAPLAAASGVSFVSLQKGDAAAQAAKPPPGLSLADFTAELDDFAATAALVASLDLVISVDTSVAHLAGAMGKPVWLLNRFDTCWRWLEGRDDSPWYPTLRQFRQGAPGDWEGVMARVRAALEEFAEKSPESAGLDVAEIAEPYEDVVGLFRRSP